MTSFPLARPVCLTCPGNARKPVFLLSHLAFNPARTAVQVFVTGRRPQLRVGVDGQVQPAVAALLRHGYVAGPSAEAWPAGEYTGVEQDLTEALDRLYDLLCPPAGSAGEAAQLLKSSTEST